MTKKKFQITKLRTKILNSNCKIKKDIIGKFLERH